MTPAASRKRQPLVLGVRHVDAILDGNRAGRGESAARTVLPVQLRRLIVLVPGAAVMRVPGMRRMLGMVHDDGRKAGVAQLHRQPGRERSRHVPRGHEQLRDDRDIRDTAQRARSEIDRSRRVQAEQLFMTTDSAAGARDRPIPPARCGATRPGSDRSARTRARPAPGARRECAAATRAGSARAVSAARRPRT